MADAGVVRDYPVYVGVWTNWSLGGRLTGSTLTLSHRNGALLTAFLALFVTFVGSRLWRIFCLILHQIFHTDLPRDGLHHQRQAILRNSTDEQTGLINLFRILWAWRRRAEKPFRRLLPVIIFASLATAGLSVGSIFSAKISSLMGNEVLLSSSNCGKIGAFNSSAESPQETAEQLDTIYNPWIAERISSAASFVQTCYTGGSENCGPRIKKRLLSTVNKNASCPFQQQICRHLTGNIRLDSGYINTQADLGINTPIDLQINFRTITHCAPLKTKGYTRSVEYSTDKPYIQYLYGPITSSDLSNFVNLSSYTHMAEQQSAEEIDWQQSRSGGGQYDVR